MGPRIHWAISVVVEEAVLCRGRHLPTGVNPAVPSGEGVGEEGGALRPPELGRSFPGARPWGVWRREDIPPIKGKHFPRSPGYSLRSVRGEDIARAPERLQAEAMGAWSDAHSHCIASIVSTGEPTSK